MSLALIKLLFESLKKNVTEVCTIKILNIKDSERSGGSLNKIKKKIKRNWTKVIRCNHSVK